MKLIQILMASIMLLAFILAEAQSSDSIDLVITPALEQRAIAGDPDSQTRLGRSYLFGDQRDAAKAVHWLSQAAKTQHPPAEFLLGMIYIKDKDNGLRMAQGVAYLMHATDNGCAGASGLLQPRIRNTHPTQDVRLRGAGGTWMTLGKYGVFFTRYPYSSASHFWQIFSRYQL